MTTLTMQSPTVIAVGEIEPLNNDRTEFDPDELAGLASSISAIGLIQPITVRPKTDGPGYWLIAGERRWRAHVILGRTTINAIVTDDSDGDAKMKMLAENKARTDLNPIEEARAYAERIADGVTMEQISKATGVPGSTIKWRVDLLKLAPDVQKLIADGQIRHTIGESMIGLDADRQHAVLKLLGQKPMNLDELWILCQRMRAEQGEQSLFDAEEFELVAEQYVADAQKDNVALTARQYALLLHDLVTELDALFSIDDVPAPLAALIERTREVVAYRFKQMKRAPSWAAKEGKDA